MHIKNERRCVACRENKQQNDMLRIAKINDDFYIHKKYNLGGRVEYIFKQKKCFFFCIKKRLLNRAFRTNVSQSIYDKIGEYEKDN